jgi:hypothetical protein
MNIATIIKIKIPVVFTIIILKLHSNKDFNNVLSKYSLSSSYLDFLDQVINEVYEVIKIVKGKDNQTGG